MMIATAKSEQDYDHDDTLYLIQDQWALSPLTQMDKGIFTQSVASHHFF